MPAFVMQRDIIVQRDMEKPNSAAAVIPTLIAVTRPVPSLRVMRSLSRLETIVHAAMIMDAHPA